MTPKPNNEAAASPRPKRRVPPAPGRSTLPPPPAFGWIGDIDGLTHGEIDQICQAAGKRLNEIEPSLLMPFAAVAYARRENPTLYPWATAYLLRPGEVEVGVLDEEPIDEEHLAELQEDALSNGEPMPDPV